MKELVSVIIPIFNTENYLSECVDSVLNQSYKNLEIILVDDGSTDNCPRQCDEYARKDSRIKVIHQKNGGLANARNSGFHMSTGQYIYFLDSDDFIKITAIEQLVNASCANDADFLFFDAICVYESTEKNMRSKPNPFIRKIDYGAGDGKEILRKTIDDTAYYSPVQFLFIKRTFIAENEFVFYNGILHEDLLYTFLLFIHAKRVVHLHLPLYFYRIRGNSIMTKRRSAKNFIGVSVVLSELMELHSGGSIDDEQKTLIYRYCSIEFRALCKIYSQISKSERRLVAVQKKALWAAIRNVGYFGSFVNKVVFYLPVLSGKTHTLITICKRVLRRK